MQGLEGIVLAHPFFAGLGAEFGQAISGCARNLRFAAGDYLFREGEPANEFHLIRHGKVALVIMLRPKPGASSPCGSVLLGAQQMRGSCSPLSMSMGRVTPKRPRHET